MKGGQTDVIETNPTTVTSIGRLFLIRELRPKGDVPGDLGF
jgi:hypothetical protein